MQFNQHEQRISESLYDVSTLSYLFLNMEHKYLSVKQICKYLSHEPPLLWHKINYTNTRGNVTRVYQEIYWQALLFG